MANGAILGQAPIIEEIDAYTKLQTVTPETFQKYGLSKENVPNDVFGKIKSSLDTNTDLIKSKMAVRYRTYRGTGVFGENNPNSITINSFNIRALFIGQSEVDKNFLMGGFIALFPGMTNGYFVDLQGLRAGEGYIRYKYNERTGNIQWYSTSAYEQCNISSYNYFIVAFGEAL